MEDTTITTEITLIKGGFSIVPFPQGTVTSRFYFSFYDSCALRGLFLLSSITAAYPLFTFEILDFSF
jgi:hypothetical protein